MPGPKTSGADVEKWMEEAGLVFRGEVRKVKASNVKLAQPGDRTCIVRVREILHGPQEMAAFAGKDITLEMKEKPPKPGSEMIFFAQSWIYAENLALREIGRKPANAAPEAARRAVAAGATRGERAVAERIESADVVVAGRVLETKAAQPPRITEHDPMWAEATVEVESVEKGELSADRVTVMYPTSMDVMWYQAPKLQVGQRGVWILKKAESIGLRSGAFAATDPVDFQPNWQLAGIQSGIRKTGIRKRGKRK